MKSMEKVRSLKISRYEIRPYSKKNPSHVLEGTRIKVKFRASFLVGQALSRPRNKIITLFLLAFFVIFIFGIFTINFSAAMTSCEGRHGQKHQSRN